MELREATNLWLAYIKRHRSANTYKLYFCTMRRIRKFLPEQAENITLNHLERFLASTEGCAASSYNNYITVLQGFGHWLEGHDLPNPTKKLRRIHKPHIPARVLSESEYNELLIGCNGWQQARDVLRFLANTGLRADEFLRLTPENVSQDNRFLHIVGKGGKPRSVPLNNICREILTRHPDLKFINNYGALYRLCDRLAKHTGIKHFSPHSIRHYFATRLIQAGVNLYQISKVLGHSETRTTEQIYLHWCQTDAVAGCTDMLNK